MFRINHAVLHVFDFESCVNVLSETELDIADKGVKSYVTRIARHALGSMDAKRGQFADDSPFAAELVAYLGGERGFLDLSTQVAEFLGEELGREENPMSCDLLVIDFEDEPRGKARSQGAGEDGAEADADASPEDAILDEAMAALPSRFFALLLLESRPAFMHEVGRSAEGAVRAGIERHHAILPNPSQKIASFALVDVRAMTVRFCDKPRTIAGEERWLLPEGLLQCSMEASSKEVLDATMQLVEEVADEYGANTAVALGRAKAYVAENADDSDEVPFDELACEVFDDEGPRRRFEEAAAEGGFSDRAYVERDVARRAGRNHKIRTDTGIEITFPAEYSGNPDFIEFTSAPNGLIQIELKNIGSIENR